MTPNPVGKLDHDRSPSPLARPAEPGVPARRGWAVMWRIEVTKLSAQFRIRIALAACILLPLLYGLGESTQSGVPADTLFGRWIHESGFALSLLILGFCSQYGLPLLIVAVAGGIFAEEDRLHVWSLLLTRSRSRHSVLAGKFLAIGSYSTVVTVLLGLSATITGALVVGTQPLVGLDGTVLTPATAWRLAGESWATMLPPVFAIMAIAVFVSVISRNSWVGVVVPLVVVFAFNLVSILSAVDPIRPFLPTTGFNAWHGLARTSVYTDQIWTSVLVNAAWVIVLLGAASVVFLRRDVVDS
jgi:ABC-2 type transport system permease protein